MSKDHDTVINTTNLALQSNSLPLYSFASILTKMRFCNVTLVAFYLSAKHQYPLLQSRTEGRQICFE